ncbi:hypothetical protein HDU81_011409 [Chytriomyces hyalinus]|nr:hypothetical protein HDU81_011409 [Chytriomyces hyalinus]
MLPTPSATPTLAHAKVNAVAGEGETSVSNEGSNPAHESGSAVVPSETAPVPSDTVAADPVPSLPPRPSKEAVDAAKPRSKEELRQEANKVKKVNFWGWVDVGFSHGVDDYDRTPIETDPLTKDGAIEVLQMRMEMRKVTIDLMRWREEYELAVSGNARQSDADSTSSTFSSVLDADEEDSATTDLDTKSDAPLRRSQSSAHISLRNNGNDLTSSSSSARESSIKNLLRRYPPTFNPTPATTSSKPSKTSLYPHPQYPTQLLPRRKQSEPAMSSPTKQRAQSSPASTLTISTTPPAALNNNILMSPTSTVSNATPPVPTPRARMPRSNTTGGSSSQASSMLSWNVLERPHSHIGSSTATKPASSPILHASRMQGATPASSATSVSSGSSGSLGSNGSSLGDGLGMPKRRDPGFVAGVAAAAAAGARWTWNEALAREHQKEVEASEGEMHAHGRGNERDNGSVRSDGKGGVLGGLVGFWKTDKSGKE